MGCAAHSQATSCPFAVCGHVLAPVSQLVSPGLAGAAEPRGLHNATPQGPTPTAPRVLHTSPSPASPGTSAPRLGSSSPVRCQSTRLAATILIYKLPCNSQALTRKKQKAAGLYRHPRRIKLLCKIIRNAAQFFLLFSSPHTEYCCCARDDVKLLGSLFYNVQ